jgi:hypothetical protein
MAIAKVEKALKDAGVGTAKKKPKPKTKLSSGQTDKAKTAALKKSRNLTNTQVKALEAKFAAERKKKAALKKKKK